MILGALAVVVAAAVADPRPELVEMRLAGRDADALAAVELLAESQPQLDHRYGLSFLRGHLLERFGRPQEAASAFAEVMGNTPELAAYGRYRLALLQEDLGHPEVAAGLIATVVAAAPRELEHQAARLLLRTLGRGGDCRLLGGIEAARLDDDNRRLIELASADCALRRGEPERARALYLRLLSAEIEDEPARIAAERLDRYLGLGLSPPAAAEAVLLGRTFHQHRQFDRSIAFLDPVVRDYSGRLTDGDFDIAYTLVRSRFWREEYAEAAAGYGQLAQRTASPRRRAQALYQQARSLELRGAWAAAAATFRAAQAAEPRGRWADAALISALRLHWRSGDEAGAEELFAVLTSDRRWTRVAARAALFLAASDLVRQRRDRAGHWLDIAERPGAETAVPVAYWRGRLAELDGEPAAAVRRYLQALRPDPYHPLAQDARRRLASDSLAPAARREGTRLAALPGSDDLYAAWLLLGDDGPWGKAALGRLRQRLAGDRGAGPLLSLAPVAVKSWPLWQAPLRQPEEMLLALGVWEQGAPAVDEHFPLAVPDLAYTGALLLARGDETRRSVRVAEILTRRLPANLPEPLLPGDLRSLLYPFAHGELLVGAGLDQRVDPYLLAAIIREESRFDPRALSAASARGLTQFVLPTAERLAPVLGLDPVSSDDLYRPEVSIPLGALYLRRLLDRFHDAAPVAVAAYNAGEPQALLWRSYCYGPDPAEYYTKVSFLQTRGYLEKVLGSWARYREIYHDRRLEPPPP